MLLKIKKIRMSLPAMIGKGYATFWHFKGRYRVVKGSRASKKSKTTALWFILNLMDPRYKTANLLVVRKTYRTLKDSCFTELKWAIHQAKCDHLWLIKESPLEMTYKPTGQKIYFRGLDDPLKVTSITVDIGSLCWCWIEEAYEISKESDFDMLDESIRGAGDVFKQITLTLNPWNERHWLKARFFDVQDDDILAITTNYLCNEWLDESDLRVFERMKETNFRRYRVAGLGEWGVTEGVIYDRWKEEAFTLQDLPDDAQSAFGLDFGYTNDPTAGFCGFVSLSHRKIYVYDEIYKKGLSNKAIYNEVSRLGYIKERWVGDSAEPKSIDELRSYGMRITGAKKGKDSINNGIQWIQDFDIVVHPRCVNFINEISAYSWRTDKFGKATNEPEDDNNHLMDAMRYGLEAVMRPRSTYNRKAAGFI